jgi:hypothetical protein
VRSGQSDEFDRYNVAPVRSERLSKDSSKDRSFASPSSRYVVFTFYHNLFSLLGIMSNRSEFKIMDKQHFSVDSDRFVLSFFSGIFVITFTTRRLDKNAEMLKRLQSSLRSQGIGL